MTMKTAAIPGSRPKAGTPRIGMPLRLPLVAALAALILVAPDLLLHVLAGILHLAWAVLHAGLGYLHLGFEHLLQEAFDLSRHAAQIITAWIGLALILALGAWVGRKAWRAARLRAVALRQRGGGVRAAWGFATAWMEAQNRKRLPGRAHLETHEGTTDHETDWPAERGA